MERKIVRIKYHLFSNKGGRERNEDCAACFVNEAETSGVFILADGLGGHGNGEIASELIIAAMTEKFRATEIINEEVILEIMKSANDLLLEAQEQPQYRRMRSTAVLLYINEDNVICAHIGDSRLYYFSKERLQFVTADHSVSYKKFTQGQISYDAIAEDSDRSGLLRVMGNNERFEPEIHNLACSSENREAFLLCSDGFWEYIKKDEMLVDLVKSETPEKWTDYMLLRHIARTDGENDNFSSIAIFIEPTQNFRKL